MFSMIFRHSTWQAKKLQASCIAFLHQTLQQRVLLLENYVTWALCSHCAMKHQWNSAPKRIRHASYKSRSALTWCISLGHATWCVKCCSTPFIILYIFSFHNKHQWRMQALSRDSLEHQHTLSHVSTLCNIAFHQQSEKIQHVDSSRLCAVPNLSKLESLLRSTNMCCLARLQIHDGATIPQIGGTITTVWAHLHALWIWVITHHPNIIEYWLSILIWMIPAQHKPTLFGFCDKQQNHLTRLLSGLACCTATFLCIYIDCLAVKESPITQLDVLLTSRGNTACQRQVSKLYYTSYQVYVINKYINTVYHILYTNIKSVDYISSAIKTAFPTPAANPDLRAQHDQLFLQRWPLGCCHLRWRFYRGSKYFHSW